MDIPDTHRSGAAATHRAYRAVTLQCRRRRDDTTDDETDNDTLLLNCCLISDPLSDKAAAAICVMAGQMQDSAIGGGVGGAVGGGDNTEEDTKQKINNIPGIAHLTEHMLFMGSDRFPGENEYDQYIQQCGGHSNAYTDLEQTVFYFDVVVVAAAAAGVGGETEEEETEGATSPSTTPPSASVALKGGLDRLWAALTGPLVQTSSLTRELQAVDAEHSKNKTQDHWRTHQLSRTLMGNNNTNFTKGTKNAATVDASTLDPHPYSSFGTGNKASLLAHVVNCDVVVGEEETDGASLEQPPATATPETNDDTEDTDDTATSKTQTKDDANKEEAYQTLRDNILAFYKQHYTPSNMTLAILAPLSIDELQALVSEVLQATVVVKEDDDVTAPNSSSAATPCTSPHVVNRKVIHTSIPPLPTKEHVTLVEWVPLSGGDNSATLELQWILPNTNIGSSSSSSSSSNSNTLPLWYQYESKPTQAWLHLLGHEGPGSLLAALRDKQWAQDLSTDDSSGQTRSFSIFNMHIDLTQEGLHHLSEVLHMIFYYIDVILLSGEGAAQDSDDGTNATGGVHHIPEWVHDELKVTGETAFRFLARHDAAQTVSSLSARMHQYKPEHYLSGPYRMLVPHNPDAVRNIGTSALSYVHNRGRNLLILVGSTSFEGHTDSVDPWYGTQYRVVPTAESGDINTPNETSNFWTELQERWTTAATTPPSWATMLRLPSRNEMLPTDFDLISVRAQATDAFSLWRTPSTPAESDSSGTAVLSPPPRCLIDSATCRLWYKPDLVYQTPKVNFLAAIRSPVLSQAFGSPETAVLSSLWVLVASELCNEFSYAASMAGLHCGFSDSTNGCMELTVSGYNHKAGILLQLICDTLVKALPSSLSQEAVSTDGVNPFFERMRNKMEYEYESALAAAPYQHGSMVADLLLDSCNRGSIHQRLAYLSDKNRLNCNDLLHFSNQLLSCFHLEVLVHGNVMADVAEEWTNVILNAFKPSPPLRLPTIRGVQLPAFGDSNEYVYRLKGWNENDENSCVVNIYQVGLVDIPTNATMSLLLQLLREPAFNVLRTEEQLGYIVFSSMKTTANNVKSLLFLIQSDSFDPLHVDQRIENFLVVFRNKILVEMSENEFQTNVTSFCESILEKSKNLGEESSKHWNAISNQTYQFHRLQAIAKVARCITKVEVIRFFDRFILSKSPYRRKLSIQMFGTSSETVLQDLLADKSEGSTESVQAIECPDQFVRSQSLFPAQEEGSIKDLLL